MFKMKRFNVTNLLRFKKIHCQRIPVLYFKQHYSSCLLGHSYPTLEKNQWTALLFRHSSLKVSELEKGEDLPTLIANLKSSLKEKTSVQEILDKIRNYDLEMMDTDQAVDVFECLFHQDCWIDGWTDILKMVFVVLIKNVDQLSAKQIERFTLSIKALPLCERKQEFYNAELLDAISDKIVDDNLSLYITTNWVLALRAFYHSNEKILDHLCDRYLYRASQKLLSPDKRAVTFFVIVGSMNSMHHVPKRWKELIEFINIDYLVSHMNDTKKLASLLMALVRSEEENFPYTEKVVDRLIFFEKRITIQQAIIIFHTFHKMTIYPEKYQELYKIISDYLKKKPDQIHTKTLETFIEIVPHMMEKAKDAYDPELLEALKYELANNRNHVFEE